jgi:hypothetical protein
MRFSSADTLNLLAVRHVPHRVLLAARFTARRTARRRTRPDLRFRTRACRAAAIQALIVRRRDLYTGPGWARAESISGCRRRRWERAACWRTRPTELNGDQFATDLRKRLDESGATIRIFNTGTLMSHYTELGDAACCT